MNIEKSLEIVKDKLLMIKKLLKNDEENGHSSSYEMQKEDFEAIETLLTAYEKEKEKNKKLSEQNEDMKALFNIQASIAKELDFNTNEKMVKFKDEYYVPDTMAINANIGETKTIELRYVSATKYLIKFDEEE